MRNVLSELGSRIRRHWMVGVGLAAVAGLIVAVDPSNVARALAGADPVALALMLPCVLLLYLFHGLAWWRALRGIEAPVGVLRATEVTYISQAFVFLPGGDLWRVPVIKAGSGDLVETGAIAGTVVFDDLVFLFVLTFAMVPAVGRAPVLAVPLGVLLLPQVAIFGILLWPALAIGLFWLALRAVHASGLGLQQVAFTYALGQVSAGLTVLPAALGAYEGMMTGLIAVQGGAPAAAALAALLYRAFNDVLMAVIGLALSGLSERSRPRSGA